MSSVMQFQESAWDEPGEHNSVWEGTSHCSRNNEAGKSHVKSQVYYSTNNWRNRENYHTSQRSSYPDDGNKQNRRNRYYNNGQKNIDTYHRNDNSGRYQNSTEGPSGRNKPGSYERREYKTEHNLQNARYNNSERQNQDIRRQSDYANRYSNNETRDYDKKRTDYDVERSDQRNRFNESETIEIKVPASCVGRIIGRQGSRIRSLEESSQARLHIQNADTKDENNEVSLTITGKESAREKAKELINEVVNQDYSSRPQQSSYIRETRHNSNTVRESENSHSSENSLGTINWAELISASMEERKKRWEGLLPIQKDFYFEDPEITKMSEEAVEKFRKENNDITVQLLDEDDDRCIPKPVTNFVQAFRKYPGIIREIEKQNFETPSPIQCQAWPILLQGHDMIGIAQTGTGKTLAFLLPAFIHIDSQVIPREERRGPSCLVFAPTRELAQQIEREANKYTYKGIRCVCLYGGGNRREQIQTVEKGVEVVIATPGRLNDLVMNNILDVSSVTYLVLDEADRMLDMGFEPQIKKVLIDIRPDRQTIMTSATWPEGVRRMANQYMTKPMLVFIGSLDIRAVHSVKQEVLLVDDDEKRSVLLDFLNSMQPEDKVIVFVDKKSVADDVASDLLLQGIECQSIHGDREQCDREQALEDLRTGLARILVATDVASRGIDIKDVTHIFNMDFPRNIEEYVHRVGRTGRAGQTGSSITLMTRSDWSKAPPLIEILEEAEQEVPQELYDMAERYKAWKDRKDAEESSYRRGGRQGGRFNRRRQDNWI